MLLAALRRLADAVDEPRPALRIRSLEGVVVALDPGPDDEVGTEFPSEVGRVEREAQRLAPYGVVRRGEATLAEAWIEV